MRSFIGLLFFASALPAVAGNPVPRIWQTETTTGTYAGTATAVGEGVAAVAGQVYSETCGPCGYDAFVRIQDVNTGTVKWSASFDLSGATDYNNAVAVSGGVVITAGYSQGTSTSGRDSWVVSAFDAASGALLWRDIKGDAANDYFPNRMIINGGFAYVTGIAGPGCDTGANCDQFTRVYDLQKGTIIATLQADPTGVGDNEALSIAVGNGLMFIGGSVATTTGGTAFSVIAYSLANRSVIWQDAIAGSDDDGVVFQLAIRGSRLVAIGSVSDDWLVRSYDAASGAIQWSQTYSLLGKSKPLVFDTPIQIAMDDDTVVVAGYGSTVPFGSETYPKASRDWVVRSYDAASGKVLWTDHSGSPTDVDEAQGGVVLVNGSAYVLGLISSGDAQHTVVRAYDARSGHNLWNDNTDRASFPYGVTITLSEADGLMTAVSYVHGYRPLHLSPPDSYGEDMLVRTYDVGGD